MTNQINFEELFLAVFLYIFPKRKTETQNKLVLLVIESAVDALTNAENIFHDELNFRIVFFVGERESSKIEEGRKKEKKICAKFSIRQIHTVRSVFFATITTSFLSVSLSLSLCSCGVRQREVFVEIFFRQFGRQL